MFGSGSKKESPETFRKPVGGATILGSQRRSYTNSFPRRLTGPPQGSEYEVVAQKPQAFASF